VGGKTDAKPVLYEGGISRTTLSSKHVKRKRKNERGKQFNLKTMKLKDLKKWVNSLTNEQLEQHLLYNSEEYSISGKVHKIEKAKQNLYYTGDDDPAELYTLKQLKDDGYEKEDIEGFDIEIPKGSFYIKIGS
jgi:uncharacterized protein YprB with RNaseH-like and TPR domain